MFSTSSIDQKWDLKGLINYCKRLQKISNSPNFDMSKTSEYLVLEVYDDQKLDEYINYCLAVKNNPNVNSHLFRYNPKDVDFLLQCLISERRIRLIQKILTSSRPV